MTSRFVSHRDDAPPGNGKDYEICLIRIGDIEDMNSTRASHENEEDLSILHMSPPELVSKCVIQNCERNIRKATNEECRLLDSVELFLHTIDNLPH